VRQPTKRQSEYLEFIRAFTDRWGIPPSFEEIGKHFRTTAPSVNSMVKMLEARGFLTRVPGAARTLRVLVPPAQESTAVPTTTSAAVADAVRVASLVIERLVPALKGADEVHLHRALDAVAAAVDVACITAGAPDDQRAEALESLLRVVLIARGMSPEGGPGRRGT